MFDSNLIAIRAEPLLKLFITKASEQFGNRIRSIFKISSLGEHGDFSVCSDVDVALLLDKIEESDYIAIQQLGDIIKIADLEYADRLSIFWSSHHKNDFAQGLGRFPALDRLDLIEHGILLRG